MRAAMYTACGTGIRCCVSWQRRSTCVRSRPPMYSIAM